tara:strand:+ start:504 stop:827 length:324 start_codon:yes stop_codon:yes gene_type:complete
MKRLKKWLDPRNEKSIGILVMLLISIVIILLVTCSSPTVENDTVIFNTSPQMDTVEVIIEYDGDREIRWYTLIPKDTIKYESIDTIIMTYPWGREEIYYYKYNTLNN